MKITNKILKEDFEKFLKYCERNHIDSMTEFLENNKIELTTKQIKLKDLISFDLLEKTRCDDFIKAAYALAHNGEYPYDSKHVKTAKLFNMKNLIVGNIKVSEELGIVKLHNVIKDNLNYKYIESVLDNIAEANGFKRISNRQLKLARFTIQEVDQPIIGLQEQDEKVIDYAIMHIRSCYDFYTKYYIKK